MIQVIKFKQEHLNKIRLQEKQEHFYEWMSSDIYASLDGFTMIVNGKILFIGGVAKVHKYRHVAWSLLSYDCGKYLSAILRIVKNHINDNYQGCRVECYCDVNFKQAHRMAKLLGFTCEAPLLRKYEIDGRDASMYSILPGE